MREIIEEFTKISKANGYKNKHIYYAINILSYLAKLSIKEGIDPLNLENKANYLATLEKAIKQVDDPLDKAVVEALATYDYLYCKPFVQQFYQSLIDNKQIIATKETNSLWKNGDHLAKVYELAYKILDDGSSGEILLDCCAANDMFLRHGEGKYQLCGFAPNDLATILTTAQLKISDLNSDIKEVDIVLDEYDGKYDLIFGDMHNFAYDQKSCPFNEDIFMQSMTVWQNIYHLFSLLSAQGKMVFFVPWVALDHLKGLNIRKELLAAKAIEKVILLPQEAAMDQRFDCALLVFSHGNDDVTFIDARKDDIISALQSPIKKTLKADKVTSLNVF